MSDFSDSTPEIRWYIAHTYAGYENKVKANLEKIIENRSLQNVITDVKIPVRIITEEPKEDAVSAADEIITVCGQSMEPQFHNGDRVLVQYCSELSYGDIGIFYVPGMGGVIKQVAHDRLHSLNPDFDDIFPYEDGAKIIGRVLGKITADMIPDADDQALYLEARESC